MDFTAALSYPFKSIAKVLTIVLVITIAIAFFLGMLLNSFDFVGIVNYLEDLVLYSSRYNLTPVNPFDESTIGLFILTLLGLFSVFVLQGFWLSGYSIRVIRHVVDGHEKLPDAKIGKDLLNGLGLFGASIVYALVFVPFFFIVIMLMAMPSSPNGEGGLSVLVFCSSFLVAIPLMVLTGWAYFIGMARCAINDNLSALFQLGTNFRLARQNVKASFSLTGYLILLGLTYGFISQFASKVIQLIITPVFDGFQDSMGVLIVITVFMLWFALNIVQEFSKMHLIAQYARQINLYDDFDDFVAKNDFI
jgi:hypothetical protein